MSTLAGWSEGAFFETPSRGSIDGGTTSAGDLWHSVTPRWGHSMHTMCSYYGMFPAKVAHYFIQKYSKPGDLVLDPFSGRGTTALQARVEGRRSVCNDLNPLAYVLSRAKAAPPSWNSLMNFVDLLEHNYTRGSTSGDVTPDIRMLYHPNTLEQICYLRSRLLSREVTQWTQEEYMTAGALAGIMHGSWRRDGSSQYLSISMPNTFSMSPTYVQKYIRENGLKTIEQDVFECLREKLARLYLDELVGEDGTAYNEDAAELLTAGTIQPGSVDLILTSPPYLQVVNYGQSNWIRLWLLGVEEVGRDRGAGRVKLDSLLDHRHTFDSYCQFLLRTLRGVERSLSRDGVAVLVIGDVKEQGRADAIPLAAEVWERVGHSTGLRLLELIEDDLPAHTKVSRIWGETKGQATNRDCALVLAHRDGRPDMGKLEVEWDEPWKDGGPDAAHERVVKSRERLR